MEIEIKIEIETKTEIEIEIKIVAPSSVLESGVVLFRVAYHIKDCRIVDFHDNQMILVHLHCCL